MINRVDSEILYRAAREQNSYLNSFFGVLKNGDKDDIRYQKIEQFCRYLELEGSEEVLNALAVRLISLRDDLLKNIAKKSYPERVDEILEKGYHFCVAFYENLFLETIGKLRGTELSPHLFRFLELFFEIGRGFNAIFYLWDKGVIKGANRELESRFGSKDEILCFLEKRALLKDDKDGDLSRSYSALIYQNDDFIVVPYGEIFKIELKNVVDAIGEIEKIKGLDAEFLEYFTALRIALLEGDKKRLLNVWQEVDKRWMGIRGELQPTHPFEYYEDIYRHSVVPELDLRIEVPKKEGRDIKKDIFVLYEKYKNLNLSVSETVKKNLQNVQISKSLPLLYFGGMMNGMFSAQVIPNDEEVSRVYGKKIFGYPDMVYEGIISKPKMALEREILDEELYVLHYELLNDKGRWEEVYDISTIGHELGHILWVDESSEFMMNRSGEFKNIEEFKATASGICAHILCGREGMKDVMIENIIRSIKLISQKESDEFRPYFCEALIHLVILFESGVISFERDKILANLDNETLKICSQKYLEHYDSLVLCYTQKLDAKEFLFKYLEYSGRFLEPKHNECRKFAAHYYQRYQDIGSKLL